MNFKSNICNIVTFNLLAWIIKKKKKIVRNIRKNELELISMALERFICILNNHITVHTLCHLPK